MFAATVKKRQVTVKGMRYFDSYLRKLIVFYARHLPEHPKKEGLIFKATEYLGLNPPKLLPTQLWFGSLIMCLMSDSLQRRVYYFGCHERRTENILYRLITPGAVFIDVGANMGTYTLLASKRVGRTGKVVSLEPIPELFGQMAKSVRMNRLENVALLNNAAWDHRCMVQMTSPGKNDAGCFAVGTSGLSESMRSVSAIPLDDLLDTLTTDKVDIVKMDIEGAELPALRGAGKLLSLHRPILVLEIDSALTTNFEYKPEDLQTYLRTVGYGLCYRMGEGKFYLDKGLLPAPASAPFARDNYVFLPQGISLERLTTTG